MTLKWKLYDDDGVTDEKLLATELAGGWDGILVSFGDGCDDDTLNMVFPSAYLLRITPAKGEDFDLADGHSFTFDDSRRLVLRGHEYDNETSEPLDEEMDIAVEDIVAILIY